jgi:hypothetical protein
MRLNLLRLVFITLLLGACSSDNDNSNNIPVATCGSVNTLNVTQDQSELHIVLAISGAPDHYEISAEPFSGTGNDPDSGVIVSANDADTVFTFDDFDTYPGNTLNFYARAVCADGTKSAWSSPVTRTLSDVCGVPQNLAMQPSGNVVAPAYYLFWQEVSSAGNYQIEYGFHGFAHGSGFLEETPYPNLDGLSVSEGTQLDFYVRAYCTTTSSWGDWSPVFTYTFVTGQYQCNVPANITYTTQYSGGQPVGAVFHWNPNGDSNFEYTLVAQGQDPNTGTIYNDTLIGWPAFIGLSQSAGYSFCVRGVCHDGNRTAWAILNFSI